MIRSKPVEKTKSTDSGDLVVGQDQMSCCCWDARWNFLVEKLSRFLRCQAEFPGFFDDSEGAY